MQEEEFTIADSAYGSTFFCGNRIPRATRNYWNFQAIIVRFIFLVALLSNAGHGLILEVSRSYTTTHHSR